MKRIIEGKLYDTKEATAIWESSYSHPGDFDYVSETLYKTANGAYFIAGEGGARSRYSRQVEQNTWSGGSDIRALTREEAFEWADQHLDSDDVQAEFGDLVVPA